MAKPGASDKRAGRSSSGAATSVVLANLPAPPAVAVLDQPDHHGSLNTDDDRYHRHQDDGLLALGHQRQGGHAGDGNRGQRKADIDQQGNRKREPMPFQAT